MIRLPRIMRATRLLIAGLTGAAIAQDGGQLYVTSFPSRQVRLANINSAHK